MENHPFFVILYSEVGGSVQVFRWFGSFEVWFLGGNRRFGRFRLGFLRFGRFEVRYFKVQPNTNKSASKRELDECRVGVEKKHPR